MVLVETFSTSLLHVHPYLNPRDSQNGVRPARSSRKRHGGAPCPRAAVQPACSRRGWLGVSARSALSPSSPGDLSHPRVCSVSLDHVRAVWRRAQSDRGQSGRWARLHSAPSCPPLSIPADGSGTLPGQTPPTLLGWADTLPAHQKPAIKSCSWRPG